MSSIYSILLLILWTFFTVWHYVLTAKLNPFPSWKKPAKILSQDFGHHLMFLHHVFISLALRKFVFMDQTGFFETIGSTQLRTNKQHGNLCCFPHVQCVIHLLCFSLLIIYCCHCPPSCKSCLTIIF